MNIIFVRHAAAQDHQPSLADEDRQLTPQGRRAFWAQMPRLLRRLGKPRQLVIWSSPAKRALQTAEYIKDALAHHEIELHEFIYEGDEDQLRHQLRQARERATLFIVGHEPHLGDWASLMLGQDITFKKGEMLCLQVDKHLKGKARVRWRLKPKSKPPAEKKDKKFKHRQSLGLRALFSDIATWQACFEAQPELPRNTHQWRVSLRRARSWLAFLRPLLESSAYATHADSLRQTARSLGALRETDVLIEELQSQPDQPWPQLKDHLRAIRGQLQEEAFRQVLSPEHKASLLAAREWAEGIQPENLRSEPAIAQLQQRFERRTARLNSALLAAGEADLASLHELRLQLKKHTNTADLLLQTGLFKPKLNLKKLKALQQDLGRLCDLDTHASLLLALLEQAQDEALRTQAQQAAGHMRDLCTAMQAQLASSLQGPAQST